jgi:formylglycine-generating enzyme required for sulfatase activity
MTNPSRTLLRRGGSWFSFTAICRPTYRSSRGDTKQSSRQLGFRVVCLPREVSTARHYLSMRGGSWFNYPWDCRSVCRGVCHLPGYSDDDIGFRVICLPPEVTP